MNIFKVSALICVYITLTACSQYSDEVIDTAYVNKCNDRGGRVERIEYSDKLQCVGINSKESEK